MFNFHEILIKVKDFFQMCVRSRPVNKSFQTGLFHLDVSFFFARVDLGYFGLPWLSFFVEYYRTIKKTFRKAATSDPQILLSLGACG